MLDILTNYNYFEEIISLKLVANQGLSNTSYILTTSDNKYFVRVYNSLHGKRKAEFNITQKAYKLGIAPKPVLHNEENCIMIFEFLKGESKRKLSYQDITKIASTIKKLHQIKIDKKLTKYKKDFVLCHQDLNRNNFIFAKKIKLIDWEYFDINDKYFDIAAVLIEFNFTKKEEKLFLKSYFKSGYKKKKLSTFKNKYSHLCTQWFKKRHNLKQAIKYRKKLF